MKLKTADLSGTALDWVVSQIRGIDVSPAVWLRIYRVDAMYCFSSEWSAGGPLYEECIANGMLLERVDPAYSSLPKFKATMERWESVHRGATILETACRCFASHTLGPEVDVPDELLEPAVA